MTKKIHVIVILECFICRGPFVVGLILSLVKGSVLKGHKGDVNDGGIDEKTEVHRLFSTRRRIFDL